jgi:hypothetical protein
MSARQATARIERDIADDPTFRPLVEHKDSDRGQRGQHAWAKDSEPGQIHGATLQRFMPITFSPALVTL